MMKTIARILDEDAERELCEATRNGRLREHLAADPRTASATLYGIVAEVVYERLTRSIERGRGHMACAVSLWHLEPECHDMFQDDVAAVRADLLRNADKHIENLRGWLVPRLKPAVVDDHRRRRGERGAQQRPRLPLPQWLDAGLGGDPWLSRLAVEILRWVGVPTAAGDGLWPLGAWADRRSAATGQPGCTELRVAADVERVLAAMRLRPAWFDQYVEAPLGKKQTSVAYAPVSFPGAENGAVVAPVDLPLVPPDALLDSRLLATAHEALECLRARIRPGADVPGTVVEVVRTFFDAGTGAEEMAGVPGSAAETGERVHRLMADEATIARVVAVVLELLEEEGRCG